MAQDKRLKKEQQKAIQDNQEVLAAELTYIGQTAFQANEDRQRVGQFFFISFGSFIAAILSLQIEENTISQQNIFFILGFVFLFVAIFGVITLLQLARLRQAWLESVAAMNTLKTFIIDANNKSIEGAFDWLKPPGTYKKWSVGYFQAIEVSLVAGVAFGTSVAFFFLTFNESPDHFYVTLGAIIASVSISFLFHYFFYKGQLTSPSGPQAIDVEPPEK
ncbi:MAG: hypothetical protein DWQ07_22790 [Chloroflexi bacterium]|nr:MAG: hypothetical protein DWQ07_22790 [Chloroflexota bacterium]MBL1193977.1 hypothetical protein [Chloroflexota bacterium]NOH11271.1 hypothetical protein [Chloroflexota bacterium]